MKLQEFVKETLLAVINGVGEAQDALGERGGEVNPYTRGTPKGLLYGSKELQYVDFDVAVTVVESTEASAGITVLGIGGKGALSESTNSVSRIKFRVPIGLPDPTKATGK
jgi:hypothetical protein